MPDQAPRTYNDPCGIARALDLIGERWALLVVRELLLGPKRFSQLRRGLHDASANVLAQRLRELEHAGVVRHTKLGPPAGVAVYELTERGYQLEPVLLELGRWGSGVPLTQSAELGTDALMVALKTRFSSSAAGSLSATYSLRVGDDRFRAVVINGRFDVSRGPADAPSATLHADVATLRSVVFGRLSVADAVADGSLRIDGDRAAVERFATLFGGASPTNG
jgi:DNA-binding HxlR family transcriptional regulator/putative sterol carrier protein